MDKIVPFLDSLALVQGVVIGIIIIALGKKKLAPLFFGLFLITYAIELGDSILIDFKIINDSNEILRFLPLNFYYLNIIFLYLFLETIVGKFSWRKHIWWLLPGLLEFAIFFTMTLFHSSFLEDSKETLLDIHGYGAVVFYILTSLYIVFKASKYQEIINETHTGSKKSSIRWIIYIGIYFIAYSLIFILFDQSQIAYLILSIVNVLFIYTVGILGLKQKLVEITDTGETSTKSIKSTHENHKNILALTNTHPKQQNLDTNVSLFEKIDQTIKKEKHYLDAELNLFKLSRSLRIQSRKLSEAIHESTDLNFKKYINKHRIEYAKTLILDKDNDHLTMTALAYDSGFQSKSTFYSSFKENVGITPTKFRDIQE